jgi:hypothetical protein
MELARKGSKFPWGPKLEAFTVLLEDMRWSKKFPWGINTPSNTFVCNSNMPTYCQWGNWLTWFIYHCFILFHSITCQFTTSGMSTQRYTLKLPQVTCHAKSQSWHKFHRIGRLSGEVKQLEPIFLISWTLEQLKAEMPTPLSISLGGHKRTVCMFTLCK